ncbi:MAG: glycosyltransferase [Candidatus Udaeobacter sp.]
MSSPVVAIISNALTPYRLHFHRRLVREVPGIAWYSLFTHDVSNAPWKADAEAEIRPVRFGIGERSDDQSKLAGALHEYRKGGRVIRWLREHCVAAVVVLGYNDAGRLRIIRWCRRNAIPCFLFGDSNIHGDTALGWKARLKRRFLPKVLAQVTGILACGSLGRTYYSKYGVPDNRIFYSPYEPDYEMIASISEAEVNEALCRHGLRVDRNYMIYCGRLAAVKRVDLIIAAFTAIAEGSLDWDLLMVGDGPLRAILKSQIPTPLKARVHWLGFMDDQREVAKLQRGSKVLTLVSEFEPWGVVINEGVAAGAAIVATEVVGAAAELVKDGVNGRVVPANDLPKLVEAFADATSNHSNSRYRSASAELIAEWRRRADPVAGLLHALALAGIRASS